MKYTILIVVAHFKFVEWDHGNDIKSVQKHKVTTREAEQVFEQAEAIRVLGEQINPPVDEPRFGILGLTTSGRHLFVCFTIRGAGVRVISARDMNRKERKLYEELCKK